jgi:hypothetical protein
VTLESKGSLPYPSKIDVVFGDFGAFGGEYIFVVFFASMPLGVLKQQLLVLSFSVLLFSWRSWRLCESLMCCCFLRGLRASSSFRGL